jgi:hypothetical protein
MDANQVVVVGGTRSAGWAKAMISEIVNGLRDCGVAARELDVDDAPDFFERHRGEREAMAVVDLNHRIHFPWPQAKVAIMVDHPCTRIAELALPDRERLVTGWVDASHVPAVAALGFPHRAVFLPHAGPAPVATRLRAAERDIDLFFAGTLAEPTDRAVWGAANPGASPVVAELIFASIEAIERTGSPAVPALLGVLRKHGLSLGTALSRDQFAELISTILAVGEHNRRFAVLTALPEALTVAVASDYLPKALRERANIRHLGYVGDFAEIRRLMGRSRIVLNMTGKFPAGSHERIWYAMAEGAVVLTDFSVFVEQTFVDGETIVYLPRRPVGPDDLAPLAALAWDAERLDRLSAGATAVYRAHHTWSKRASLLIDAIKLA